MSMSMRLKQLARALGLVGAGLLGVELFYVLVANGVIRSGVIERAAAASPDHVELGWDQAFSPWPGRAHVKGFRVAAQDPVMEFRLTLDEATLDVALWALLHKTFRASNIRAEGLSFRFLARAERTTGEARLDAFPPIKGFSRPAWAPDPTPPPLTTEQLAQLWTVHLDDVDATISELWFLEYRYQGAGHLAGGFALSPMRSLWVGPAQLDLDGGTLSAGEHVVSSAFTLGAAVTITPVDLPSSPGLKVLRGLTTSMHFDAPLEDLGVADLYLDGLRVRGTGTLSAALEIAEGRLTPGSTLSVELPATAVAFDGQAFSGQAQATLTVPEATKAPEVLATLSGALAVRLPDLKPVKAELSGVSLQAVLADNDLSSGLSLARMHAVVAEARVPDARPITGALSLLVPFFAKVVLGDGPLVASATAYVTPEYTLVRLKKLTLGDGAFEGAAVPGAQGWLGAAAGHFGRIPLGIRLRNSTVEGIPFTPPTWLNTELLTAGIVPEKEPADPQVAGK